MKQLLTCKIKAFLLHLVTSAVLIFLLVGGIICWFFPYPFWAIDDIKSALQIIVCADLILGPLLTFLLYKPKKKGLLLDMLMVFALQICALAYGTWAIHSSRPIYLIHYGDSFYLADQKKVDQSQLLDSSLRVDFFDRPKILSVLISGTTKEQLTLSLESLAKGEAIVFNAKYLHAYKTLTETQYKLSVKPRFIPAPYNDPHRYAAFYIIHHRTDRLIIVDKHNHQIIDVVGIKNDDKR